MKRIIVLVLATIMLVMPVSSCGGGHKVTCTSHDTVTFPDFGLEYGIRLAIHKPTGDICQSDLNKLTRLDAEGLGIRDLSGIERCTNLNYLDLGGDPLGNISQLRSLSKLNYLNLGFCNLTSLDGIEGCRNLVSLNLGLTYAWELQEPNLLPLQGLTNLRWLDLTMNNISDITALQNLTNLQVLSLEGNRIVDLTPLQELKNLTWLDLLNNPAYDISALQNLNNLAYLGLCSMFVESFEPLLNNDGLQGGDEVCLIGTAVMGDPDEGQKQYDELKDKGIYLPEDHCQQMPAPF